MTIFDSIILGIVEGITEFLPVSSTGHLILTSSLLGIPETDFVKTFEIAIQLGAILAVVALYWKSFLDMEVLKRLIVAFIPTGIIGFLLYKLIKGFLGNQQIVLWALLLGGVALIVFELLHKEREEATGDVKSISYKQSFLIGLAQSVAMVPGISRSAATIVGGLLLGIKRIAIVEFSFLLAVPTMAAATGYDVLKNASTFSFENMTALIVGFVVSFFVALLSIKWLLTFVRSHSFIPFGVYRIALALLFFIFVL